MPQNINTDHSIILYADEHIYSKDAIVKCMYWYSDRFRVAIEKTDGFYKIELTVKENIKKADLEKELINLERDLQDFNLRDLVTKETKTIRELLIAKAFSYEEK